jgi:virulence plasmid B protein
MRRGREARSLLWRAQTILSLLVLILATCGPAAWAGGGPAPAPALECPAYDGSAVPGMGPLAKAPAAEAGMISGFFALSSSGTASYTIPIAVPPGRQGMEPRLWISYNSGSDIGLLGKGFSLAGLSSIHRCGSNDEGRPHR